MGNNAGIRKMLKKSSEISTKSVSQTTLTHHPHASKQL